MDKSNTLPSPEKLFFSNNVLVRSDRVSDSSFGGGWHFHQEYELVMTGFVLLLMHEIGEGMHIPHRVMEEVEREVGDMLGIEESPLDMFLKIMDFTAKQQASAIQDLRSDQMHPSAFVKGGERKCIVINEDVVENFEGVQNQIDYLLMIGYEVVVEVSVQTQVEIQAFLARHSLKRYAAGEKFHIVSVIADEKALNAVLKMDVDQQASIVYVGVTQHAGLKDTVQVITGQESVVRNPMFPVLRFAAKFLENSSLDPHKKYAARKNNIITLNITRVAVPDVFKQWFKQQAVTQLIEAAA